MEKKRKRFHYLSIFWQICKKSKLIYVFGFFIILYFTFTIIIYFTDIDAFKYDFGNALWFTFSSFFTVGYGDFTVTTPISRIFTIILIIYGAVIIAMFTAIWVNMITIIARATVFDEQEDMYDKLCNLHKLPKDELEKISNFFKKKKDKRTK